MASKRQILTSGLLAVRKIKFGKDDDTPDFFSSQAQLILDAQIQLIDNMKKMMGVNDAYGLLKSVPFVDLLT